jgi:hypothetical protein
MKMALHQISSKTKVGKIKTKMRTKSFWHYLVPEDLSVVVVVVVVVLSVILHTNRAATVDKITSKWEIHLI